MTLAARGFSLRGLFSLSTTTFQDKIQSQNVVHHLYSDKIAIVARDEIGGDVNGRLN